MKKRILAALLSLVMIVGLLPISILSVDSISVEDASALKSAISNISTGGTITLERDITLNENLTIDKVITINGDGYKITAAENYSAGFFTVNAGAKLTLDNVTLDGNNNWKWKIPKKDIDYSVSASLDTLLVDLGQKLSEPFISVTDATLVLTNKTVIQNVYAGYGWSTSQYRVIYGKNANISIDGSTITHCVGETIYVDSSDVTLNDAEYTDNLSSANKGGFVNLQNASSFIMDGDTKITGNIGYVRSGLIGICSKSTALIKKGEISNNTILNGGSNACGVVICLESGGDLTMTGGTITKNAGMLAGAIASRWTENDSANSGTGYNPTIVKLTGGEISDNATGASSWGNATLFLRNVETTIGETMTIEGDVNLNSYATDFENNGTINGNILISHQNSSQAWANAWDEDDSTSYGKILGNGTVSGYIIDKIDHKALANDTFIDSDSAITQNSDGTLNIPADSDITIHGDSKVHSDTAVTIDKDGNIVVKAGESVNVENESGDSTTTITGPAVVGNDGNVTVSDGGKVGDIIVPPDDEWKIPLGEIDDIKKDTTDGSVPMPEETVVTIHKTVITGAVVLNVEDGSATITDPNTTVVVDVVDKRVTITGGPSHVNADGSVAVEDNTDTTITLKDGTVGTGEASIDKDGNVTFFNKWTTDPHIVGWTYGEQPPEPVGAAKYGTVKFTYSKVGENDWSADVPTNAGSYEMKATVAETSIWNGLEYTKAFTIEQSDSVVSGSDAQATYGEEITLTVNVSLPSVAALSLYPDENKVSFYCGETPLGTVDVVNGVATLEYDTTMGGIPTGSEQTITVYYGGSNDLKQAVGSLTAIVSKAQVIKPTADTKTFIYSGSEQTYAVEKNTLYTIDGNTRTNAGSQIVTVSLIDKVNYEWADNTTDDLEFIFVIGKADAVITVDTKPIVKTYGESWNLPEATSNFGTPTANLSVADMTNAGNYTLTYTVEGTDNYNGATQKITVTIEKSNSTVTPGTENEVYVYVYGDTITFTAEVTKFDNDVITADLDALEQDHVYFYCGSTLLGEETVTYDNNAFPQKGTATLEYNTISNGIPLGEANIITAVYSGGDNLKLNDSKENEITITLTERVLGFRDTFVVGGITITGPATIKPDNVTVEGGGMIGDATVPSGMTISVPTKSMGDVNSNEGEITLPIGSTIEKTNSDTIVVTGSNVTVDTTDTTTGDIEVDNDGSVTVNGTAVEGPATITDTTVAVKGGGKIDDFTVPNDAIITIPTGSIGSVTTADGVTTLPNGTVVTNDYQTITVTTGTIEGRSDGTITIPTGTKVTITNDDSTITVVGPGSIEADGTVTVTGDGKVTINGVEYTVDQGSSVTVDNGKLYIPSGNTVTDSNGKKVTGVAEIDDSGITIKKGSSATVGDTTVTATSGDIKVDKTTGAVTIPDGSTATVVDSGNSSDTITVTGEATVSSNSDKETITVKPGGTIGVGGKTYEVEENSADITVDVETGKMTVPDGGKITDGTTTITGPTTVDPDSESQQLPSGSSTTVGDTSITVISGNVTKKDDGSVNVAEDAIVKVGSDTTITGPAKVNTDGKITVAEEGSVTNGKTTVTVTNGTVEVDSKGNVIISKEDTVKVGENDTTITGPAKVNTDGKITVDKEGSVTNGKTTVTVTNGTVEVNSDGSVKILDNTEVKIGNNISVTGPADVDKAGNVTVEAGGSVTTNGTTVKVTIGSAEVKDDGTVVISSGSTVDSTVEIGDPAVTVTVTNGSVTVNPDGTTTIPEGSTVVVGGVTITGPAKIADDGSVIVSDNGKIYINSKDYKVTDGPVTVKDGEVIIPEGSTVSDGTNTIVGPTTVDGTSDGQKLPVGSEINLGDTSVTVTTGEIVLTDDGSVEIPVDSAVTVRDQTITGPATVSDDGKNITVSAGGTISDGDPLISVTSGPVSVKDDGTVDVPAGSTVIVNGQVINGPATVDKNGEVIIGSNGSITQGDTTVDVTTGHVTVDENGKITVPDKYSEIQIGDTTITGPASVDKDGDVTVDGGGTITNGNDTYIVPDDTSITVPSDKIGEVVKDENGETVIPEGSTITKNDGADNEIVIKVTEGKVTVDGEGNVTVPDESEIEIGETTITGPASVDKDGDVTVDEGGTITNDDNTYIVPEDTSITVPSDKIGEVIKDENGETVIPEGSTITKNEGTENEIVIKVTDGKVTIDGEGNVTVPDDESKIVIDDTTITGPASVDKDGDVTVDEGGTITNGDDIYTVPDDTSITVPGDGIGDVKIDEDGNLVLPDGSKITTEDGTVVEVTDGAVTVDGNGNIAVHDDSKIEIGGITITGPASVEDGNIKVDAGGEISGVPVPDDTAIIVPTDKVDEVKTNDKTGTIILPSGSTIITGDKENDVTEDNTTVNPNGTITKPWDSYKPILPISLQYTLTFNTNGGTMVSSVRKDAGTTIDLTDYIATREGYIFDGWYSDARLTNKITSIRLSRNTTVYAGWTKIENPKPIDPVDPVDSVDPIINPFSDIHAFDWYYDDVMYVYEKDLMNGTGNDRFSPTMTTTRGMIVTILYRLEGGPKGSYAGALSDVPADAYYASAVEWAAAYKILSGYGNGIFGPDDPITREQMATILWRYAQYKGMDVSSGNSMSMEGFADAMTINSYALPAMKWVIAEGIIGGRPGGILDPAGKAQRCEVAVILHRFCKLIEE